MPSRPNACSLLLGAVLLALSGCGQDHASFTQSSVTRDALQRPADSEVDSAASANAESRQSENGDELTPDDLAGGPGQRHIHEATGETAGAENGSSDIGEGVAADDPAGAGEEGAGSSSDVLATILGLESAGEATSDPVEETMTPEAGDDIVVDVEEITVVPELSLGLIQDICMSKPATLKSIEITFPAYTEGCAWEQGDNLDPVDGVARARVEEYVPLELAQDETLCGVAFSSDQQQIYFDDELLLTFNDAILMSSYNYNDRFTTDNGLVFYNWPGLIDGFNPGKYKSTASYCIGDRNGTDPGCQVPITNTTGQFQLTVAQSDAEKLSLLAKQEGRADVGLVITGDNDSNDCKHSEIRVTVDVMTVSGSPTIVP